MIKGAVFGFGNLGRGVLKALLKAKDFEAVGVFSRREKNEVITENNVPVFSSRSVFDFADEIDVLFVCGGSSDDLPIWTPRLAEKFNVVDSFDRHREIPKHYRRVQTAAEGGGRLALIGAGWDPGIFSLVRCLSNAVIPSGKTLTLWGEGISQGHSEALRRIRGVKDAYEVTVPKSGTLKDALNGIIAENDDRANHVRRCFVVAEEGADRQRIKDEIRATEDYFKGYETEISFVTESALYSSFPTMYHGGYVFSSGDEASLSLKLSMHSNPEFTGGVLVAYGRALFAAAKRGRTGSVTVLDLPVADMLEPNTDSFSFL